MSATDEYQAAVLAAAEYGLLILRTERHLRRRLRNMSPPLALHKSRRCSYTVVDAITRMSPWDAPTNAEIEDVVAWVDSRSKGLPR